MFHTNRILVVVLNGTPLEMAVLEDTSVGESTPVFFSGNIALAHV